MPIYEYRCQQCRGVTAFFVRSISAPLQAVCDSCGSERMERRMSGFAVGKTTAGVQEANPMGGGSREYYRDPRNIGRYVEETFTRHGVAMPDTVRESIDAARSGEAPKGIDW